MPQGAARCQYGLRAANVVQLGMVNIRDMSLRREAYNMLFNLGWTAARIHRELFVTAAGNEQQIHLAARPSEATRLQRAFTLNPGFGAHAC